MVFAPRLALVFVFLTIGTVWSLVGKLWSYKTGDRVYSSPALSPDGKVVYVGSTDKSLYAINAADGSKLWSYETGDSIYGVQSSPALSPDGKVVYVGSQDKSLHAINATDGSKLWSYETGDSVFSSPAVSPDGKVVYVGSWDNSLYAINAADGSKLWSYETRGALRSSPAVSPDGKVVYVGSQDNLLYAINAADGSKLWSYETGAGVRSSAGVESSPALSPDGKVVYVGSCAPWGASFYAINAADGSKLWSYQTMGGVQSSPALSTDGKVVYVGSLDKSLYAINAADGSKLWSYKAGWLSLISSPALSPDGKVVYVGSDDNSLYAINTADGSKLWSYETGDNFTEDTGESNCSGAACPPGKYGTQAGLSEPNPCFDCEAGTYQDEAGQTSCKAGDDTISPAEIQQIAIGLGVGLLAIIAASLLDLRYRSDKRNHSTPMFTAIGLAAIAVDILTAFKYFQGPTYADFPQERGWWGGIFVATLVVPIIGNIVILGRFLRNEGRSDPTFSDWMDEHMSKLRPIFFLAALKYGSVRLIHCRVAGLGFLSAPLSRRTTNKLRTYGTVTALLQDVPQLALIIYVAIKTDKSTWLTGAKLGLSVLTLVMAVVGLVVGLIAVRLSGDRRSYDVEGDGPSTVVDDEQDPFYLKMTESDKHKEGELGASATQAPGAGAAWGTSPSPSCKKRRLEVGKDGEASKLAASLSSGGPAAAAPTAAAAAAAPAAGNYEPWFDSVPEAQKLRLPTGEVLHDTAIVPDFCEAVLGGGGVDHRRVWAEFKALEFHPDGEPIPLSDGTAPVKVRGTHRALSYRGRAIARHKVWLQTDFDAGLKRYGYTGWQYAVAGGTFRVEAMPEVDRLRNAIQDKLQLRAPHTHWIGTYYADGDDNIGAHSDKMHDWAPGSCFIVLKLGAARRFEFTWEEPAITSAKLAQKRAEQALKAAQKRGTAPCSGGDDGDDGDNDGGGTRGAGGGGGGGGGGRGGDGAGGGGAGASSSSRAEAVIAQAKAELAAAKAATKAAVTGRRYPEVIFSEVLAPGTAVIVGSAANARVKHGVPVMPAGGGGCGASGSFVGRCITTTFPWADLRERLSGKKGGKSKGKSKGKGKE
eukprot:g3529.t1